MLQKKPLSGKKFQVTFTLAPIQGVSAVHLCGEFNGWSLTSHPMLREEDGSWSISLTLEGGKSYTFRYCDDKGEWHNDLAADAYVPNQYGSENSVLDLAAQQMPRETREQPAAQSKRRPQSQPPRKPTGKSPQQRHRG